MTVVETLESLSCGAWDVRLSRAAQRSLIDQAQGADASPGRPSTERGGPRAVQQLLRELSWCYRGG